MSTPTSPRDEYPAAAVAMLPPGTVLPPMPRCHRCSTPATVGWQRQATAAEAEQHWTALETHIRSQPNLFDNSNATYTADRNQAVTKAVHGCDKHDLSPEPATDHDGSPEAVAAAATAAKQAGTERRVLTHAADCGGHGACQCEGDATDA